jgi:hypothetical protein
MRCELKLPSRGLPASVAEGVSRLERLHLATPSKETIVARARGRPSKITTCTFGMISPKRGLPKAPTTTVTMTMRAATTMEVATTEVTTVETMAMKTLWIASDVLSNLPSIHRGSLHVGR